MPHNQSPPAPPARAGGVSTVDAVVVVPGIMGSALSVVDQGGHQPVWGVAPALLNAARLGAGKRLDMLRVREEELSGEVRRVVPTGLLGVPGWLPGLGGAEPYGRLLDMVRQTVLHPDAALAFAYDWRLDIEHNGRMLAHAARAHLDLWRRHPVLHRVRAHRNDNREPRLVIVAHSMGGLLVRAMSLLPAEEQPDVRAVVTLGTPFSGSVKTMQLLATGGGSPLRMPKLATRKACLSMPGVYDLLPWYRCRDAGDDLLLLGESDVAAVGGVPEHIRQAFQRRARTESAVLAGHQAIVGVGQQTAQSFVMHDGEVVLQNWAYRRNAGGELIREGGRPVAEDHGGDGTVFRHSARTRSTEGVAVAQQHQALASTPAALHMVTKILTEVEDLDTVLGDDVEEKPLGLDVPDEAEPDSALEIGIRSSVAPAYITCSVEDTSRRDEVVRRPEVRGRPGQERFTVRSTIEAPGLYRVRVVAGTSEVTKLVMVTREDHDLAGS